MSLKKICVLISALIVGILAINSTVCYALLGPYDYELNVTSTGDDSSEGTTISTSLNSGINILGSNIVYSISNISFIESKYTSVNVGGGATLNINNDLKIGHVVLGTPNTQWGNALINVYGVYGGDCSFVNINNGAILTLEANFGDGYGVNGLNASYGGKIIFDENTTLIINDTTGPDTGLIVSNPYLIYANGESDTEIRISNNSIINVTGTTVMLQAETGSQVSFGDNTKITAASSSPLINVIYGSRVTFGDNTEINISNIVDPFVFGNRYQIYLMSYMGSTIIEFGEKTRITYAIDFGRELAINEFGNLGDHYLFNIYGEDAKIVFADAPSNNNSKITMNAKYSTLISSASGNIRLGDNTVIEVVGAFSSGIRAVNGPIEPQNVISIGENVKIILSDPDGDTFGLGYIYDLSPNAVSYGIYSENSIVIVEDGLVVETEGIYRNGILYKRGSIDSFVAMGSLESYYRGSNTSIVFLGEVSIKTKENDSWGLILQNAVKVDNTVGGNDKPFTITTEGDRSHGLVISSFLKEKWSTSYTPNEIVLNNLVIEVSGDMSNALHIVTLNLEYLPGYNASVNVLIENVELSFKNMNAKAKGIEGLAIFGATGTRVEVNLVDSTLEGDIVSTGFVHVGYQSHGPMAFPGYNTINKEYNTSDIDLLLYASSWEGSRLDYSPYEDVRFQDLTTVSAMVPFSTPGGGYDIHDFRYTDASNHVNLYLSNGSSWIISKDSHVTTLAIKTQDSAVAFREHPTDPHEQFYSAYTTGMLIVETDGKFSMNVNMHSPLPLNDVSIGKGNHFSAGNTPYGGAFVIEVSSSSGKGGAYTLELIEILSGGAGANFSLLNTNADGHISLGAYKYELVSDNDGIVYTWSLQRAGVDDNPKPEIALAVLGFSEFAKAIDASLSDELLKHRNMIWVGTFYKLQNFESAIFADGLTQNMGGNFIGIDVAISDMVDVGQFFGLGIGHQSIETGSAADITSLTTGTYATIRWADLVANAYVRVATYSHDFSFLNSTGGEVNGLMNSWGGSVSAQALYKFRISDDLFIKAKGKATFTAVKEMSYDVGGLATVNLAESGLVTWLGAIIGFEKTNSYDKSYGCYLEAGWIHDTNPTASVIFDEGTSDEETETLTIGKDRLEVGLGLYASPLGISSINVEVKYAKGKGITEFIKLQAGASCYF